MKLVISIMSFTVGCVNCIMNMTWSCNCVTVAGAQWLCVHCSRLWGRVSALLQLLLAVHTATRVSNWIYLKCVWYSSLCSPTYYKQWWVRRAKTKKASYSPKLTNNITRHMKIQQITVLVFKPKMLFLIFMLVLFKKNKKVAFNNSWVTFAYRD